MTFKQWIKHLWAWITGFPLPRENEYLWIGLAGKEVWDCPICGAHKEGEDE